MGIYQFTQDDAVRFAEERGIRYFKKGDELHFEKCPYCGRRTNDKLTFAISLETGQFNCKRASCGAHGNMLTLAKDFNFSLGTSADEYYRPKRRYRTLKREKDELEPNDTVIEYFKGRGISEEIVRKYHITVRKDQPTVLVFPFYDEQNNLQFVKYRKTDFQKGRDSSKEWCEPNCKPILFGIDNCDPQASDTLILTEGQIDSLSVAECGIPNAVSVPTGANGFTWVPYCWDFLGQYKTLIVFGDHEHEHITLLDEMKVRFHGTVKHVREEDYKDCKDANEILVKYGKQAVIDAVAQAVPVEVSRIRRLADVERQDITQLSWIDSGIRSLDRALGGFFFGQLVIVTGASGTGKSTVISYICAHAIRQNATVFIYSGELPDWQLQQWFDRQVAGPKHINKIVSGNGFTDYSVIPEAAQSIHEWYEDLCYFYDNGELPEDEDEHESLPEILEKAIVQYGCRVLMIDNLMTAIDDDVSSDFYRQQSAFVRKLVSLAKKYNVLIFLVAHPRKTSAEKFGNDDISGTGNIVNLADVVLRYARLPDNDKRDHDRILQVFKNRLTGRLNTDGIGLYFDQTSKRISETPNSFDELMGWEGPSDPADGFEPAVDGMEEIPF